MSTHHHNVGESYFSLFLFLLFILILQHRNATSLTYLQNN